MQEKCIHCGREQYAPAVYPISMGEHPCVWCGKMSEKMTVSEYRQKRANFIETERKTNRSLACGMNAKCDK